MQSLSVTAAEGNSSVSRALASLLATVGTGTDVDAALSAGQTPYEILQETVSDRNVYDLTGCSLDQTLYFISQGIPVYAQNADGSAVLLTGYDDNYVWVYDTGSKQASSRLLRTAEEQFAEAGNVFLAIGE
jgi:hypothetical protein